MEMERLKLLLEDVESNPAPTDADIQFAGAICSVLLYNRVTQGHKVAQEHLGIAIEPIKPQLTTERLKEIVTQEIARAETYTDMQEFEIAKQGLECAKYFLSKLKMQAITDEDKIAVRELWAHFNLAKDKLQ